MKRLTITLFFLLAFAISISAQTPQTISFQGVATDNSGSNLPDGDYMMIFKLYNAVTGGSSIWSETQNVTVSGGVFSVILGSIDPITLPFDEQYWLGVKIESDSELEPRIQLTSSPYSFSAGTVEDGAITENKIEDGAVTQAKLAAGITAVPSGTANGDLSGSYPNPTVAGLQSKPLSSSTPLAGEVLKFDGTQWAPGTDNAGGGSLWSANGSNLYYNDGNVGIGTNNPMGGLDIYSSVLPALRLSGFPGSSAWEILINANGLTFYRESVGGHDLVITNDGAVKVQNNDLIVKHEIQRTSTGDANLVPIAYGTIGSDGTIYDGSTDNFSVSHVSTGDFLISIVGYTYYYADFVTVATITSVNPGFISTDSVSGKLKIRIWNASGVTADNVFSFVVYKK
ncbi:MAG: hypothetical protein GXO87_07745 [Chlorobi bacterium]|nr:hypothetical protein [Chlorobiota bacterium]